MSDPIIVQVSVPEIVVVDVSTPSSVDVIVNGQGLPGISMPPATATADGYLLHTDWTTFNGKQPAGSYVTSGGALGTPASGNLTNCTFPTLNQNTAGTAASATTATNVSGGTVSATTGSFSGIMSPIGIGIAPGTPKLTIASSANTQASMIEAKDTNGGGTYTSFKLESDQNGSGIWSQYILGVRKFYFSPWFGSPSYILVNMGFGTTNTGATVDIKGAGTTTGLALRTQDSGGNDKFSVIDAGHVKISSMTTTVRDSVTASNGMICYNTTTNKFQGYEGGAWVNII